MKILKKLAAAVAVVMAISMLAACGNDDQILLPQEASKPSAGTNPVDTVTSLTDEFNGQVFKSKVTSADSNAKELITVVCSWIADDVTMGGAEKRACELKIVVDNGKATITDASGENSWEGKKGDTEGKLGAADTLQERFDSNYFERNFTAAVFIDESGYAVYSWYVHDDAGFNGDAPSLEDFKSGVYGGWKSENREGMTTEGVIIGTYPKLHFK